jgi:predicted nucleic acid-binding protein
LAGASVDTNILVYASGLRRVEADEPKIAAANSLVADLIRSEQLRISAQALAELRHVLVRRSGWTMAVVTDHLARYLASGECQPTSQVILQKAFELAAAHGLQTYDAIILAAAAQGECDILYSEDMQHLFEWNGVMVVNPFA